MKLLLAVAAVLIGTAYADDCKEGDVWAEGKIKMVCTADGTRPVACLPNGKLGDNELEPGQSFSSSTFRFRCVSNGALQLSFDVVGCLLPTGGPIDIGQEDGIANKGVYRCVKNADGTISRKFQAGCWFGQKPNAKLYTNGQAWKFEDKEKGTKTQITCNGGQGSFEAQASGCYSGNELIQVGAYFQDGSKYMKCGRDEKNKQQANFIQVGEQEYFDWQNGQFEGEEESAIGDSGSGLTRPPTTQRPTQRPTTPEPHFETSTPVWAPTTFPTEAPQHITDAPQHFTSTQQPFFHPTSTQESAPAPAQCQDLHPICSTLCSTPCSGPSSRPPQPQNNFFRPTTQRPVRPTRPVNINSISSQHQGQAPIGISLHDDTEPVGFAFERSLFGSLFNRPKPTTPKSVPNRLAINSIQGGNKPQSFQFQSWNQQQGNSARPSRPSGFGFGHSGGNSFGGNSWGNQGSWGSGSWWTGGNNQGQQWNQGWGNQGGKPSGGMAIIGGGKPTFGGHHHDSSSSSSEEGGHFGGHHGRPTGRPHGPGGRPGGPGGPGGNGPAGQCFGLASSAQELIDAMCPKSCGACGRQINLQAAAAKYSSSKCTAREPSIGLELEFEDDFSTPSAPQPPPTFAPFRPTQGGRPQSPPSWQQWGKPGKGSKGKGSKGKHSKNHSKGKNKSKGKGKKSG